VLAPNGQQKKSPRNERNSPGASFASFCFAIVQGAMAKGQIAWVARLPRVPAVWLLRTLSVKVTGAKWPPRRVSDASTRLERNSHDGCPNLLLSLGRFN
jgi:hypothetical protein